MSRKTLSRPSRKATLDAPLRANRTEPLPPPPPTSEAIRDRAYAKWERAGRPPGDGVMFWLEAERELTLGS